ncbi:O-antigen ligase family protein [Virgibacillus sp. MG-45]|uniref:O-antigen ligase family protein n=1 Tax=Virgibacillus sp. MG-45 TaxID=3102791 RepID=UPI002EDADC26
MDQVKYRINFLVLIHVIALVGLIFPYGFPLYSISILAFWGYSLLNKSVSIKNNVFMIIMYLSITTYIVGVFNSEGVLYNTVINDLIGIFSLLLMVLSTGKFTIQEYTETVKRFLIIYAHVSLFFALISLFKYYSLLNNKHIQYFEVEGRPYPWGTALMPDYNMFALAMLVGLVATSYLIKKSEQTIMQVYGVVSSLIISLAILFSGSRRGWIVLLFLVFLLMYRFLQRLKNNTSRKNKKLILTLVLICISFIIIFKTQFNLSITNSYEFEKLRYRFSTLEDISSSLSSRTSRLEDGILLMKDFNIVEFIFGEGFSYLSFYGEKYIGPGYEEYPHNPLLSAFLYSGIIGLLVMITLLVIPIFRSLLSRLSIDYMIIYLIVLFFLIQSANSIFSTNIFWLILLIYCLIPVYERRVVRLESDINSSK